MKNNITVILPLHKIEDEYLDMLNNSLESVQQFHHDIKVLIVTSKEISTQLVNLSDKIDIKVVVNEGSLSFQEQMRVGLENCETEWFSILEVDDEYVPVWLRSVTEYISTYPDVDIFLPVVKDINVEGQFLTFVNEASWAYGFTDKIGELDIETLLEYQNYQTSGGVYRTEKIKENGGLFKDNIELTFTYEFLLRMLHNGLRVMTIPRVGYRHVNMREDSLFWSYMNDEEKKLDEERTKYWIDIAKKEYFYKDKRELDHQE